MGTKYKYILYLVPVMELLFGLGDFLLLLVPLNIVVWLALIFRIFHLPDGN